MTLQASGAISLNDVLTELRVSNPGRASQISLLDADVVALAGKSGAPVALTDLYGKSSVLIAMPNVTATRFSPTALWLDLNLDGTWTVSDSPQQSGTWINVASLASQYEVYVTKSGAPALASGSDALATWLPFTEGRTWGITTTTSTQQKTVTLSLQFRKIGTTEILDTANVFLSCDSIA